MSLRDTIISIKEDKEAAKSKWIEALRENRNEALSLKDDEIFISVLREIFSVTPQVTPQVASA